MTTVDAAERAPRIPLSRGRVLRRAISLADEGGVPALSIRNLARELGVGPMALYYHFANKDEVLDAMVDLVFGEIELPANGGGWRSAMRRRAISARQVLLAHRWAVGLMESRTRPGPANLRHHDTVLRILTDADFSMPMAAHAYSLLDSYIYGFVLQEISLPFDTGSQAAAVAEAIVKQHPAEEYPHLAAMGTQYVMQPGYDHADEFEFGLDLILEGIDRVRQTP